MMGTSNEKHPNVKAFHHYNVECEVWKVVSDRKEVFYDT